MESPCLLLVQLLQRPLCLLVAQPLSPCMVEFMVWHLYFRVSSAMTASFSRLNTKYEYFRRVSTCLQYRQHRRCLNAHTGKGIAVDLSVSVGLVGVGSS